MTPFQRPRTVHKDNNSNMGSLNKAADKVGANDREEL